MEVKFLELIESTKDVDPIGLLAGSPCFACTAKTSGKCKDTEAEQKKCHWWRY